MKDIIQQPLIVKKEKILKKFVIFFAEVQNKLHFAITGKTAFELVVERHSAKDDNFEDILERVIFKKPKDWFMVFTGYQKTAKNALT